MKLFKKRKKKVSRNTLEIKYIELLERHNKYLEKQIDYSEEINYYKEMYETLFNHYKNVLENSIKSSDIYKVFLDNMDSSYINNTSNIRKVIDYIAGMTDDYFVNRYNEIKIER